MVLVRLRAPICLLLGALGVCLPAPARAQGAGALRGLVADLHSVPIPGVTLTLENSGSGVAPRGVVTRADGAFFFLALPPARDYVLRVSCPGFATVVMSDVEVRPGETGALAVTLQPAASLRDHVEVRARPSLVNLIEPAMSTRLSDEFMESLPILGRNYQDVLTLAPGVSDVDGDGNPNVHGSRDTDVITLVDGVSTTDPYTGKVGAQLNLESIQEIEFKTSGATAEFGRAQGGFANIITKSGGNEFEGAFKFFWRSSVLDGDGAGVDDPTLHAGFGAGEPQDVDFNDTLAFLSFSGPVVRDHAWFYLSSEYIDREDPVHTVNTALVAGVREFRNFLKLTWQATTNSRLAFSVNSDPQEYLNEGLNSFTRQESGYTDEFGGLVLTARATSVLSPTVVLETSLSSYDEEPGRVPTLGPDTNRNGETWVDRDHDGLIELSEHDPGEDLDGDGRFDVYEPLGFNVAWGSKPYPLDHDMDLVQTLPGGCEGNKREDINCDGGLDVNEDLNGNGIRDPGDIDWDEDGRLDLYDEDRNGNGRLDDTPFPKSLYPYGRLTPLPPDRFFNIDRSTGVRSGPYWETLSDERSRVTLRLDTSIYVPEFRGTHDLKTGFVLEDEGFRRQTERRPIAAAFVPPFNYRPPEPPYVLCFSSGLFTVPCPEPIRTFAINPIDRDVAGSADALNAGLYLQDLYRPAPNLSLGIGVRFDRESVDAAGYTPFDPIEQRDRFGQLAAFSGYELLYSDYIGNADGITALGVAADPIFRAPLGMSPPAHAFLTEPLYAATAPIFVRHHGTARFASDSLKRLFPEAFVGDEVLPEVLERLGVHAQRPQSFNLTNNNLSPRLSVNWDPWADGRTRVFATWGRYYDRLFLSTVVGEQGPDTLSRYYLSSNRARAGVILPLSIEQISSAPPSVTHVDRALETPYSDEFTVGFEREVAPEVALLLTFVQRRYRNQLQDVDINHRLRFAGGTEPLDLLGRLEIDPDGVAHAIPDGRPDLYINNPFFNQILQVGNYNDARYNGIVVGLRRRLARRWEMSASYTYSRATGDAEDLQSREGNDPSVTESEFGYLDYDQRHVVKINGAMFLPRDWQAGGTVTWGSGLPFSVVSRFFALDDFEYPQFRTKYGYTEQKFGERARFVPVRRNGYRNEPTLEINLSAKKSFVLGRTSAALFLEVFNLLNSDDLRIYTYEPTPDAEVRNLEGTTLAGPLILDPSQYPQGLTVLDAEREFGRRFQVGFQIDF